MYIIKICKQQLDHPQHSVPILGGMWGFASIRNRELAMKIFEKTTNKTIALAYNRNGKSSKQGDQSFLADIVWPLTNVNATIHDSYFCRRYGGAAFPTKRKGSCFAAIQDLNCELINNTFYVCPEACRPKEHLDWVYC
jgi:hypothetical protein